MDRASPQRPIIIAHRGASGYLPEHTLAGKALAYGMGADFLEQDVVASADGEAIVFHDRVLDHTTDVRQRFPGRSRDDGLTYVIDFTLEELRQLGVTERRARGSDQARWPSRFPVGQGRFQIVTLAEELAFINELNRATGRQVGVYVEIKHPQWHRTEGVDLAAMVLSCLEQAGLGNATNRVFIQCFDFDELKRLRQEGHTSLPFIQLLNDPAGTQGEGADAYLCSAEGLAELSGFVQGIGPPYGSLVLPGAAFGNWQPSPLLLGARARGLLIHPYTFRADAMPLQGISFEQLLEFFLRDLKVDGIFCDFPDRAVRVRDAVSAV